MRFAGLSLYTSFMPSAVAAIISADVSSALGLFAGVPNFPISLKSAFTVLINAVEARRPAKIIFYHYIFLFNFLKKIIKIR